MRFFLYSVLLVIVITAGCRKKEFPESRAAVTSDFYCNGTIDGAAISLNAGKDHYYMFSSNNQDANGLYSFVAEIKPGNCDNCNNSIKVKINDFRLTLPGDKPLADSSLVQGLYSMNSNYNYAVQYNSIFNQTGIRYLWEFGDGTKSAQANPVHTYSAQGNYSVGLRITSNNGCDQLIRSTEKISYPAKNCRISVEGDSVNTVICSAYVQGVVPYRYLWDFGDNKTSTLVKPSHTYAVKGTYQISLRLIDTNNDTTVAKYNHATKTQPMVCLTNYSVASVTPVLNPLAFSNVTVTWTDYNGTVYTSDNPLQPAANKFEVLSVENYEKNEKGESTKKLKVRFKCNVYNGSVVKLLEVTDAVIAVSY